MQPIKLTISGAFWDTQIYMGFMYLFKRDGSLMVVDWDRLVTDLGIRTGKTFAIEAAFRRSDHLYGPSARMFLEDRTFKDMVISRFGDLAQSNLQIDGRLLGRYCVQQTDSPSPFPHADSLFYNSLLYTVGKSGVYCSPCTTSRKGKPVGTGVKRWDGSASACAASYNTVALATGENGLYEMISGVSLKGELAIPDYEPREVTDKDCTDCSWSFFNIFGTSRFQGSFLVQYRRDDGPNRGNLVSQADAEWYGALERGVKWRRPRHIDRILEDREIFGGAARGYEVAYQDKIYSVHDQRILIVKANPYASDAESRLSHFGEVQIDAWKGSLVSAKVAVFGVVLEYDSAIVVVGNGVGDELEIHTIRHEPVSWRVFPRSANYRNHLHVIRDDELEVWSFNHDYFVQQSEKKFGTRYSAVSERSR